MRTLGKTVLNSDIRYEQNKNIVVGKYLPPCANLAQGYLLEKCSNGCIDSCSAFFLSTYSGFKSRHLSLKNSLIASELLVS